MRPATSRRLWAPRQGKSGESTVANADVPPDHKKTGVIDASAPAADAFGIGAALIVGRDQILASGVICRASESKFDGESHRSKRSRNPGQSRSIMANQAVSRFSPLTIICW